MSTIATRTTVITDYENKTLDESGFSSNTPVILKGLVKQWKLVEQGRQSDSSAINYLKSHYNGRPSVACIGQPEIQGRFFYDAQGTQLNYQSQQMKIDEVLDLIQAGLTEKRSEERR